MHTWVATKTLIERFESRIERVPEGGCWLWTGNLDRDGYGQLGEGKRKKHKTHRLSYTLYKGIIPKGQGVHHTCDNPCCVNPHHLWTGTQTENMMDRHRKGRTRGPWTRNKDID